MVSEGPSAGGIWDKGLGVHCGANGPLVVGPEVTWQLNATGLSKVPTGSRSMVAVAVSPGTTAVSGVSGETVRVNCP
jgi:hypothetical protein